MGCPVVATDVGSTRWQLRGDGGTLVRPGDIDDLAEKLLEVLRTPCLLERLSVRGMRNARDHSYESQALGIAGFVADILVRPENIPSA